MIGRLAAVMVMIACAAVLAWHHRADLMPAEAPPESPAEAAYRACLAERSAHIDGMIADGVVDEGQAATFKARADALCRDLAGE